MKETALYIILGLVVLLVIVGLVFMFIKGTQEQKTKDNSGVFAGLLNTFANLKKD